MANDFKERKMNIPEPSNLDGFEGGEFSSFLVEMRYSHYKNG